MTPFPRMKGVKRGSSKSNPYREEWLRAKRKISELKRRISDLEQQLAEEKELTKRLIEKVKAVEVAP